MSRLDPTGPCPKKDLSIAFDTWTLSSRFRNHGIYVYAKKVLSIFRNIAADYSAVIQPFVLQNAPNDANQFGAVTGFQPSATKLLRFDRLWRFGGATAAAVLGRADLVFCPTCTTLPLRIVPVVATIHDVTPVRMPSHSARITRMLKFFLWCSANFSHAVITDSECSKRDLVEIYGLPPEKISVVYLGYDRELFNCAPPDTQLLEHLLRKHGIRKPYVFHHGVIQPRKNLQRLIEAYSLLLERNRNLDLQLVLAGPLGWQCQAILHSAANGGGHRGKVVLTGAIPDQELALLIKGASLTVIPSLYEGFCLPMVEAMACGVPTIASKTSCLPEISGGVLRYFDPLSVEQIAQEMERALEDSTLRQVLISRSMERAATFSWERCAQETMEILVRTHGQPKEHPSPVSMRS